MNSELDSLFKNIEPLSNFKSIEGIDLAGIYAVWWTGSLSLLASLNRDIHLQGKQITIKERKEDLQHEGTYHIHKEQWHWNLEKTPVCMYVGKANNINNRLKQHLEERTASNQWYSPFNVRKQGESLQITPCIDKHFLVKRTTACQVRAGIEHLFKNQKPSSLQQKLSYFGVSFICETSFITRFYLEDLAIGYFRPWFNLDSER